MSEKKFLKAVNKAKKGDLVIWNEATGEVLRGKASSERMRRAIMQQMAYKFHKKPKKVVKK